MQEIFNELGLPKKLVIDGGKEFGSNDFKRFLEKKNIIQHVTSTNQMEELKGCIEIFGRP